MKYTICLLLVLSVHLAFGQKDDPNCKDHPLLARVPGTYISLCSTGEDMVEVPVKDTIFEIKSGKRFYARYSFDAAGNIKAPSFEQIVSHYERIVLKNNGKKIYSGNTGAASLLMPVKTKEIWIVINDHSASTPGSYEIITVEEEVFRKVTPLNILDDLSTSGTSVLYMKFENDTTIISPESAGMIDVIVELMLTETDLNISIEAHTDIAVNAAENQKLSESRAQTIYDAVVAKGIDKKRLKHKGWGETKQLFDSSTEIGRTKNNRIELRKI